MTSRGWWSWSRTAANNATADATINMAEGMAPSAVNDGIRSLMAKAAEFRDDFNGLTLGGSSTAYTATTNQQFDTLAHLDGAMLTIIPSSTSGASPTLNVDGLGAKAINKTTGVALSAGAMVGGVPYQVRYNNSATEFILIGQAGVFLGTLAASAVGSTNIANGAVQYAHVQNVAAARLLGNPSSTTSAAPSEISVSSGLAFTGSVLGTSSIPDASLALPGAWKLIETQTPSGVGQVDFETGLDDTYDAYEIRVSNFKPATDDARLWLRVKVSGSYQTSGYRYTCEVQTDQGTSVGSASASASAMILTSNTNTDAVGNASGENWSGRITFDNPEASDFLMFRWHGSYNMAGGSMASASGGGCYGTAGATTGIRLMPSTGNISGGRFSLYGLKKS